jgi:hypothetical protein
MIEAERKLVVMETPREAETQKKTTGRGAEMLRQAASMVLEDQSLEIALALADSSIDGHIQCAKFLYDLAKLQEELGKTEVARKTRSLASEWADEPQWTDKPPEEAAETGDGSHEPEDAGTRR